MVLLCISSLSLTYPVDFAALVSSLVQLLASRLTWDMVELSRDELDHVRLSHTIENGCSSKPSIGKLLCNFSIFSAPMESRTLLSNASQCMSRPGTFAQAAEEFSIEYLWQREAAKRNATDWYEWRLIRPLP